jgi:hypothetical protein
MRRFKGQYACLTTAAFAWSASACAAGPTVPDLLTVAHRVTPTADWAAADSYGWRSDRTVLFFRAIGKVVKPVSLDAATGRQTPLSFMNAGWAEFAKDYQASGASAMAGFTASLSPDGRRLYWTVPAFDATAVYAADVDGPSRFQFSFSGDSPPSCLWRGDSQELVSFHSDAGGLHAKTVRLDKPSLSLDTDAVPTGVTGAFGPRGPVLVTPDHRILSDDWVPGGPATATLHVMQAALDPAHGVTTGTATITLPPGAAVEGIAYSPQGDRIAWMLRRPGAQAALWVCRIDGTAWREIGALPSSKTHGPDEDPTSMRWLPSGKGISFLYRSALWTVSVPGAAP